MSEHLDQGKFKSQLFAQKFESDFELSFWLDLKNLKKFVKKIFFESKKNFLVKGTQTFALIFEQFRP